ncbi:MAG: hypothetical protein QNK37_26345 [Acidobacteriota bacterium]|nr:hypothetical protein [Acidobacteriota bacterium]
MKHLLCSASPIKQDEIRGKIGSETGSIFQVPEAIGPKIAGMRTILEARFAQPIRPSI